MKGWKLSFVLVVLVVLVGWRAPRAAAAGAYPLGVQEQTRHGANWVVKFDHADLTDTNVNTAQSFTNVFVIPANYSVEVKHALLKTAFRDTATNANNSLTLQVGDSADRDYFLGSQELCSDGTEVSVKHGQSRRTASRVQAVVTNAYLTQTLGNVGTALSGTAGNVGTALVQTLGNVGVSLSFETIETNGVACVTNVTLTTASVATNVALTTASVMTNYSLTTASVATNVAVTCQTTTTDLDAGDVGTKVYTADDYLKFTFTPHASYAVFAMDAGEVWVYVNVLKASD